MPPAKSTAAQKSAIAQFVSFTSAKDSVAARHLKSHGWNVEEAVDAKPWRLWPQLDYPTPAPLGSQKRSEAEAALDIRIHEKHGVEAIGQYEEVKVAAPGHKSWTSRVSDHTDVNKEGAEKLRRGDRKTQIGHE